MAWTIEISLLAEKQLGKLDRQVAKRIYSFLQERVEGSENPRRLATKLEGNRDGLWRYRVGDYRIVCQFQDDRLVVLVVRIGHRSDIYR